jgi:hypothetical protein
MCSRPCALCSCAAAAYVLLQDAVRALLPGQLEAQPELLDQLGTMVHPRSLKQAGVAVFATLQVRLAGQIDQPHMHT